MFMTWIRIRIKIKWILSTEKKLFPKNFKAFNSLGGTYRFGKQARDSFTFSLNNTVS